MLTESFIAATSAVNKAPQHLTAALKDVGIFLHEFQPQAGLRHGFKKSSVQPQCLAVSQSHIFAAQSDKAVINVYSREKGSQEATVPFPERIRSTAFADDASILVIGTENGKLVLWEVATGRLSSSTASHIQPVSSLCITPNNNYVISGSADSTVFVWSLSLLLSFSPGPNVYENDAPTNAAIGTFSNHRSPITALSCGHSRPNTNFAVSASEDKTCYVWHIETCQVIRTVLLPLVPLCATLDPADRAVYFGSQDGAIISVDLLSLAAQEQKRTQSSSVTPFQILADEVWNPTSQFGAVHGITLSHDGTSVLSGHANGAVVQWDVAKQKMSTELINLGQPVTNIQMLSPEGLCDKQKPAYTVPSITKPKPGLNNLNDNGTCGIPSGYSLNVSLTGARRLADKESVQEDLKVMMGNGWQGSMLENAIRAIENGADDAVRGHDTNLARAEKLEDENLALKQQVVTFNKIEQRRTHKTFKKLSKLEEIGEKRRQAYFQAKKQGEDGDAAMKAFDEEIEDIRAAEVDTEEAEDMDTS